LGTLAALGYLPPAAGAVIQEVIDLAAVVNALRVALLPGALSDYTAVSAGRAEPAGWLFSPTGSAKR